MAKTRTLTMDEIVRQLREKHPDLGEASLHAIAKRRYVSKNNERRARQLKNLELGRGPAKNRKPQTTPIKGKAASVAQQVAAWNIIEFATRKDGLGLTLHPAQEVLLRALYGLHLNSAQRALLAQLCDGNANPPKGQVVEAIWALGARSGKSFMAAIVAIYEATRDKWRAFLRPGEVGYIVIVATRLEQARAIIQRNAAQMILNSPLACLLDGEPLATEISFVNGMKILSLPANSTAGRGLPICCLIFDEIAHFAVEGAKADADIYASLRPRLAQFAAAGAKTIMISTPAAKQGTFWHNFKDGFSVPGRLTAQCATTMMNPTIPQSFVDSERRRDPDNCAREFDAQFAERTAAYLPSDRIAEAMTLPGDLPPAGHRYFAGIDQSGLSGRDRFAMTIAHKEIDGSVVVDAVRSWATSDADEVMTGVAALAKRYSVRSVLIDRYAGGWVRSALEKIGLWVDVRDQLPVVYSNLKSLLVSARLRLPENAELREGLEGTRAFYGRNNSLSVAHERSSGAGHGDLADATATAVWACSRETADSVLFCDGVFAGVGVFAQGRARTLYKSGRLIEETTNGQREFQLDPVALARVMDYPDEMRETALEVLIRGARFN